MREKWVSAGGKVILKVDFTVNLIQHEILIGCWLSLTVDTKNNSLSRHKETLINL